MAEDIEMVDGEALAVLERLAQERDGVEALPPTSKARKTPAGLARPENPAGSGEKAVAPPGAVLPSDPTLTPLFMAGADGKVVPYVADAAVADRLRMIEADLAHLGGMVRHTMLLVMIQGDRERISTEEYDKAAALVAARDKQIRS